MKFTVISHAGMLVEAGGLRIVVDPWIVGSSYWRSWWNYPPPPDWAHHLEADYVYISHLHWDHFHGPSLRKLPRTARLLVPECHFPRMRTDGELFKFAEVVEMPHAKTLRLPGGVELTSYQFGLMADSALVISDGRTTLVDMNDCKLTGRSLQQMIRRHPRVDFVLRSYSSACAYPWCVKTDDPSMLIHRSREDYMVEFVNTAQILRARYAIPFASAHCFLHKDVFHFNEGAVSPDETRRYFDEHKPPGSECVVMLAGDSWDDTSGFRIEPQDWFTNRDAHLVAYRDEKRDTLEAQYALEARTELPFRVFQRYFQAEIESFPRLSRLLFKPKVVFELDGRPDVHWVIDYDRRAVYEAESRPADYALCVTVPALVLKDCLYKRMFATFSASKRLSIEIPSGHHLEFMIFFNLLNMYEHEYFPMRRMLRWRFIRVWARRWREVWRYVELLWSLLWRRPGEDPLAKFVPRIDAGSGRP